MTLPLSLEPVIGPMLEVAMNAPKKVKLSKRCEAGDHDFDHVTAACRRKHCTATLTAPLFPMTQAEEEATYGFSAARAALGLKPGDQQTTLFNPLGATQIGVLESLRRRGKWFEGCGWKWNTTRETVRALDSLAEKGLVTKSDDGKRVVYMPSAQQNPSLIGTLASWTAAGALADTVLTPVRNAVESMVGSALNPPAHGEREFRGAVAAAKRLLAAGPTSKVARRKFEAAVERCAGKSGVDPSDIADGAMREAQQPGANPVPGENLYTCRYFMSGGYATDCEKQARGEGDQPPRGWTQPGMRMRAPVPLDNRRFQAYQCPACERYGREVRERYERSRGRSNPSGKSTKWTKAELKRLKLYAPRPGEHVVLPVSFGSQKIRGRDVPEYVAISSDGFMPDDPDYDERAHLSGIAESHLDALEREVNQAAHSIGATEIAGDGWFVAYVHWRDPEEKDWQNPQVVERPQVVAKRLTADGVAVWLWSDGALTGRHGHQLSGVSLRPPREEEREARMAAAWLLMGDVSLYNADEIGALFKVAVRTAERGGTPGDMREAAEATLAPRLTPNWEVYQTDRDGRPTIRVWRLPRMRWPGLAVWDHVSVGARGARYEIMSVTRDGTGTSTGVRFATLRELTKHLLGYQQNPPTTALPEDPWRYFTAPAGTQLVPLSMISPIRARPGGIQRAGEFMLAAYEGRGAPRKPITLAPAPDGTYVVCDGNSTFANAVASGWNAIPATLVQTCETEARHAAANPPRSTRVTFGRMSRGSGTEAGQADQDVLLDGQRAGVIEAEIVDANERSSSRSARYVVVGYRVTFWAVEAPDTTFAVQPGESPRAALARAQAHAIQVLEQLPPAQAQTNPWEPYHEPRQIPAWWLPGGHEDPAPVGGVSTEEIRQIARYEYEHELTPEQQDSAAINALGRAVFPWSSLTRGQLVKFRGEIQRQQTEARRAQDSPECRAKRHARCQGACRCWCHTQETQANPSDELDVQGDYASEATPLTVSVLTGMESPGGRMTVAEIAREAEVSESAVRKLLPSFKASGYVRRYETRRGRDVKRGYVWELSEKGMELLAWARRHAEEAPGATDFDPYEFEPKLPITGETVIDYEVDRGDPQDGPVTIHAYDKRAAREAGVLVMQLDPGYAEESRRFSGLSGPYALVVYVRVHPDYRRIGVGTRLHERAAREAAIRDLPLVSPDDRTRAEGAFWAKQLHKHRARLARYHDAKRPGASRYVLAYPPPDSLNPR